jgi:hypothetical protein
MDIWCPLWSSNFLFKVNVYQTRKIILTLLHNNQKFGDAITRTNISRDWQFSQIRTLQIWFLAVPAPENKDLISFKALSEGKRKEEEMEKLLRYFALINREKWEMRKIINRWDVFLPITTKSLSHKGRNGEKKKEIENEKWNWLLKTNGKCVLKVLTKIDNAENKQHKNFC